MSYPSYVRRNLESEGYEVAERWEEGMAVVAVSRDGRTYQEQAPTLMMAYLKVTMSLRKVTPYLTKKEKVREERRTTRRSKDT